MPVNDGRCHRASTHSPAILGHVTHVCPPTPQVSCRVQGDLFGGSGRSRTFLRSTSTRSRGASGMRHGGPNRHPCSCHALRHPTGRHPSLTHPLWVPRACWTGCFRRTSSRRWPPRRTSRIRASRGLHLLQDLGRRIPALTKLQTYARDDNKLLATLVVRLLACEGPRGIDRGRTDFRACIGLPACVINIRTM